MKRIIIIGRYGQEGVDSQLLITIGANESTWGQMGSVPQSVSRQHCSIEVMGNGYLIHNLNPMNVTYVNGQPVASRLVETNDVIELGQARYSLIGMLLSITLTLTITLTLLLGIRHLTIDLHHVLIITDLLLLLIIIRLHLSPAISRIIHGCLWV